jgi:hypothetical protein
MTRSTPPGTSAPDDELTLARSGPASLAWFLARCREEDAGRGGGQFQRAKQHDDKTIGSVRMS